MISEVLSSFDYDEFEFWDYNSPGSKYSSSILVSKPFKTYRFISLSSASETSAAVSPTPALPDGHPAPTDTYGDRKLTSSLEDHSSLVRKTKKLILERSSWWKGFKGENLPVKQRKR